MDEFSHLKSKLLAEQVEEQIYHYILDTPLNPGSKLPNEFELGEKFGVGRSTIREAVKLLSSRGIVEVRRGSGTYVLTTALGMGDPLGLSSVQDKTALALDLVNVRLLLEPGIAEMAANNATDEGIARCGGFASGWKQRFTTETATLKMTSRSTPVWRRAAKIWLSSNSSPSSTRRS